MNIWLSGRFEGVLEIWASKNGPKTRIFGVANPRFFLFTNPSRRFEVVMCNCLHGVILAGFEETAIKVTKI